jgi:hypothetical protein
MFTAIRLVLLVSPVDYRPGGQSGSANCDIIGIANLNTAWRVIDARLDERQRHLLWPCRNSAAVLQERSNALFGRI